MKGVWAASGRGAGPAQTMHKCLCALALKILSAEIPVESTDFPGKTPGKIASRRLLELEGHYLKCGWYGCL